MAEPLPYNYDLTSENYDFLSYRHEEPHQACMTMKTESEKLPPAKPAGEPQLFKEVDQNIMEYKQMEEFILSNLNKDSQKMQVPALRLPYSQNEAGSTADGHNFTLSSVLNQH